MVKSCGTVGVDVTYLANIWAGDEPTIAAVFTSFTGEGRATDEQPLFSGGAVTIDSNALSGLHKNELPLNLEIVGFPN
jgi:hypothetical protein